jgi:tricorn protease-like protein
MNSKRSNLVQVMVVSVVLIGLLAAGLPLVAQNEEPPTISREDLGLFKERYWSGDLPVSPEAMSMAVNRPAPQQRLMAAADWTYLVYQSYRDGNWEIYLAHAGQEFRLTNNSASDARPRLNFDATKVAFNSNRDGNYEIYAMNIDGSNVQRLTYNTASDSAPAWSPDGTKIAFMSNRDGNYEIYLMNADGSNQTRFTYSPSTSDVTPTWSPDGGQIAWVNAQGAYGLICVMNTDGSGIIQLEVVNLT